MKALVTLFTITIMTLPSFAAVNMRNGSYTEAWTDFIEPADGFEMKIERFYSSRSLFIGVFGFGWCSSLETHLTITSDGILNLTECGGGLEVTYYPENFDLRSPEQTVAAIVKDASKKKKMSTNDLKNLRAQLLANTKMRFQYANRLGLVNTSKIKGKANSFLAKSKGVEKIDFNGRYYERKRSDGYIERFSPKGQLNQIINPMGLWLKIHYKGKNIAYLVDNQGRRINFSFGKDGKLSRIYNGNKLETHYKFDGENLAEVTNMWAKTYSYKYDANHNLTQVDFPDKTKIKMSYDIAKDWIKSYTNRLDCREDFEFLLSKNDPQNHYWGTFDRACKDGPKMSGRHEFWYKSYSFSPDKYLHRVKESYKKDLKDVYFHPYLGRPVSVRENELYMGFAYYLNGLVNKRERKKYTDKQKILNWEKTAFTYDFKKLLTTETIQENLNALGKTTSKEKTLYAYSKQGLLKKAYNKKGHFVSLAYNQSGKIKSLKNHKGKEIKLSYEIGKSRPSEIHQPDIGKISIQYDNQGEVESVKSLGTRNIASSVVASFLEMITFLGPPGEKLKL